MQKYTYVSCQSCGRTIKGVEDYDEEISETIFCSRCRDDKGHLKPFAAVLEVVACDIQDDCGCSYEEAIDRAKDRLKRMPHWKNSGKGWELPNVPE